MAKTKGSKNKEDNTKKIECSNCHRELTERNFYNSKSPMFPSGKVNICKDCIQKLIDYTNMESIYQVLRTMDIPFFYDAWESMKLKNPKNPFGNYIRQANSGLNEFKGARWKDSIFEPKKTEQTKKGKKSSKKDNPKLSVEEKDRLENEWGDEWNVDELLLLDKTFKELSADKNMKFNSSKQYMKLAVMNYVRSYMAMKSGNAAEAEKYTKLFNETMKMGEFNPSALAKNSSLEKLGSFSDFNLMVEECVDLIDLQKILPNYMQQPRDLPDKVIWYMINYMQDSLGMKRSNYEDIYKFYIQMEADYRGLPIEEVMKEYPMQSTINDYLNIDEENSQEDISLKSED